MAFSDPKTVTINAIAKVLPRISTVGNSSIYFLEEAAGSYKLTVSHQYGKRKRSMLRLDVQKFSTDPLVPAQNINVSTSTTVVVDAPLAGTTNAERKLNLDGLIGVLTATSGADAIKFLGGEN